MTKTRIAFNGFGRTGRQAFKAIYEYHPNLEVVGVAGIRVRHAGPRAWLADPRLAAFNTAAPGPSPGRS